jgi:hypothetical protein
MVILVFFPVLRAVFLVLFVALAAIVALVALVVLAARIFNSSFNPPINLPSLNIIGKWIYGIIV